MNKTAGFVAATAFTVLALASWSEAAFWSGSLSSGAGLSGAGVWASGTTLSWQVDDQTSPGYWHYSYTLSVAEGQGSGISHAIFEASLGFALEDLLNASGAGDAEVGQFGDEGGSNPNIPDLFYGIKFEHSEQGDEHTLTVSFDSLRVPVWGDFYAKGGSFGQGQNKTFNAVWNDGFGSPDSDPAGPPADGSVAAHLLVPDTVEIPEPASIGLLLVGLTAVAFGKWRRSVRVPA